MNKAIKTNGISGVKTMTNALTAVLMSMFMLTLSSCLPNHYNQTEIFNNSFDKQNEIEKFSWKKVDYYLASSPETNAPQCKFKSEDSVPLGKGISFTTCKIKLIERHILPAATYPDLVKYYNASLLKAANEFDTRKITKAGWIIKLKELDADYEKSKLERLMIERRAAAERSLILEERAFIANELVRQRDHEKQERNFEQLIQLNRISPDTVRCNQNFYLGGSTTTCRQY